MSFLLASFARAISAVAGGAYIVSQLKDTFASEALVCLLLLGEVLASEQPGERVSIDKRMRILLSAYPG